MPLEVRGSQKMHICAFARAHRDGWLLSVAPRLCVGLRNAEPGWPLGEAIWQDTTLMLPPAAPVRWKNVLTGASYTADARDGAAGLAVASILDAFPVALLVAR